MAAAQAGHVAGNGVGAPAATVAAAAAPPPVSYPSALLPHAQRIFDALAAARQYNVLNEADRDAQALAVASAAISRYIADNGLGVARTALTRLSAVATDSPRAATKRIAPRELPVAQHRVGDSTMSSEGTARRIPVSGACSVASSTTGGGSGGQGRPEADACFPMRFFVWGECTVEESLYVEYKQVTWKPDSHLPLIR